MGSGPGVVRCTAAGIAKVQQGAPAPAGAAAAVDYDRDVRPILEKPLLRVSRLVEIRGKLRLHTPAFMTRGGSSGPIFVAGKSDDSLIIRRVLGLDDEDRMPLDADPLSDAEIATLRAWVESGASFGAAATTSTASTTREPDIVEHWAYVKPRRPSLPTVANETWVRNPIDRFVLARLDREKLSPGVEAPGAVLLRRITLDLIGLPPTPEEVDAFVDDRSPDAYEKVVDRLLASPHYGERWARPWLDLARYADTNGFEKDNRRSIWTYRDWVIDALNRGHAARSVHRRADRR